MIAYPTTTAKPIIKRGAYQTRNDRRPAVVGGNVSINAQWQHCALLVYAVPHERVAGLTPTWLPVEKSLINGREMAQVSVAAWLDQTGRGQFEQTSYRLHVRRDGAPAHWLLGTSLGALTGVATRGWWNAPWHLGAMEFQVAYDQRARRYRNYQLQTQSHWANARWQLNDSGQLLDQAALPATWQHPLVTEYYARRDGSLGCQRTRLFNTLFTRGHVEAAQCDLLERLGVLRGDELIRPQLVALQHSLTCQLEAPTVIGAVNTAPVRLAA
jgi:hypothetical protein